MIKQSKTTQTALMTLFLSLTLLACGGGGSSSSESGASLNSGGSSNKSGSNPTDPVSAPIEKTQVSLVDPMDFSVMSEVSLEYLSPSESVAQTTTTANPYVPVDSCVGTPDPNDPGSTPCILSDGTLWVPCHNQDNQFRVLHDGTEVSTFHIDCSKSSEVKKVPNRNFVMIFSVDSRTDEIVQHNFNTDTLDLTVLNRLPTGRSPQKIIQHPTGNMLYVLNRDDSNIASFHVSGLDQSVEEVSPRVATGPYPMDIVINSQGSCLYVNNVGEGAPSVSPYSIGSQGTLTALTKINFNAWAPPTALTLSKDGLHAYVATAFNNAILHYSVNPTSCVLTLADSTGIDLLVSSMIVNDAHNRLYVTDTSSNSFRYFDLQNGSLLSSSHTSLAPNTNESVVPCSEAGCEASNTVNLGQILLLDNYLTIGASKVFNGGSELKAFYMDPTGYFAYATRKDGSSVDVYLVNNDCTLEPYFSTVQGGDSLGVIVNMIPLEQQDCSQSLYIPENQTLTENSAWISNLFATE